MAASEWSTLAVERRTLQGREVALVIVPAFQLTQRIRIGCAGDRYNTGERIPRSGLLILPRPIAGLSDLNLTQFENEYLPAAFSDEDPRRNDRSLREGASTPDKDGVRPAGAWACSLSAKIPRTYPAPTRSFSEFAATSWPMIFLTVIGGAVPDLLRRLEKNARPQPHRSGCHCRRHRSAHCTAWKPCNRSPATLLCRTYERRTRRFGSSIALK